MILHVLDVLEVLSNANNVPLDMSKLDSSVLKVVLQANILTPIQENVSFVAKDVRNVQANITVKLAIIQFTFLSTEFANELVLPDPN